MKKDDFIVYGYKHRDSVLKTAITEALNDVYAHSYPKPEKSFTEMCNEINEKRKADGREGDDNYRVKYGKWLWPCDFFYIPKNILEDIWNSYKEAYNIKNEWDENMKFLEKILFDKPGFHDVYSPTKWSDGESVRHCEDMPLLKDVIGEDSAKKVKEILDEYKNTYRFGITDVMAFCGAFMSTPTCVKENVEAAWKELGKDITVPDDSIWIDNYEYDDKVYEGEIEDEE